MNENKAKPLFGIGGVTLLTVLLILCLTLFSVLALSSAQADLRLSEKNATTIAAYYAAENQAYALMANAEGMWPAGDSQPPMFVFAGELADAYPEEYDVCADAEGDSIVISADIPVQEGSFLRVALTLRPEGGPSRWEVRQWQLMPPAQDEGDIAFLPVWMPF
ncbi:MAG: hypothetical protein FWF83_08875 [Clostridiales bacterium]|nr:hypothetical protein [Clostridiales bacterium]